MELQVLNSQLRKQTGRGASYQLRKSGKIPAVCYKKVYRGDKKEDVRQAVHLTVDPKEVSLVLNREIQYNKILKLVIKDEKDNIQAEKIVIPKDFQINPLKQNLEHLDLLEISMDKPIVTKIPFKYEGTPVGIKLGSKFNMIRRYIDVECLPGLLPSTIPVDITPLGVSDSIRIAEITPPAGVTFKITDNFTICYTETPKAIEETPKAAEAVEAAEKPEEGEKAAAEKGEKGEKAEKAEKPEKAEKAEKPGKGGRK